jgi:hypothetical protein
MAAMDRRERAAHRAALAAERAIADRLPSLEQQRGLLMHEREKVGKNARDRQEFDSLARRFNERVREKNRDDLVVPLFGN